MIDHNKLLKNYKDEFEVNGILIMKHFEDDIKSKQDLTKILNTYKKVNENEVNNVWNNIHLPQPIRQISKMNEGNNTEFIDR